MRSLIHTEFAGTHSSTTRRGASARASAPVTRWTHPSPMEPARPPTPDTNPPAGNRCEVGLPACEAFEAGVAGLEVSRGRSSRSGAHAPPLFPGVRRSKRLRTMRQLAVPKTYLRCAAVMEALRTANLSCARNASLAAVGRKIPARQRMQGGVAGRVLLRDGSKPGSTSSGAQGCGGRLEEAEDVGSVVLFAPCDPEVEG